jgi:ATP-dependent DNA helicase PIF1
MKAWDRVSQLAREILGESAPEPCNLAEIESAIVPERGERSDKIWSSTPLEPDAIEVFPEYAFILEALKEGCPSLFVTGKAGTGKSTLIRWLMRELDNVAVVAPTAIAAVNVQGDTIHAFFNLPPVHIDPDGDYPTRDKARLVMENIHYLLIDEVSMVVPNLVDAINLILQRVRQSDEPFGGVPTVFIGDLLQLPPVVSTPEEAVYYAHRYKTPYFFSAEVFAAHPIIPINLAQVRRQSDQRFIEALNHIRVNQHHREHVALFNRTCYRDKDRANAEPGVYLVPTNAAARRVNSVELNHLPDEPVLYEAATTGRIPANKWRLPVPDRLELKVGAKILFVKNKKPKWINGDMGEIVGLEKSHIRVKKHGSDSVLVVAREEWQKLRYTYNYQTQRIEKEVVGTFSQFPVTLGWAITIHKSQGMTLDYLTLDLGKGAFCEGQTYVALSRARSIEGITLAKPIAMGDVKSDPAVLEFYRRLGIEA